MTRCDWCTAKTSVLHEVRRRAQHFVYVCDKCYEAHEEQIKLFSETAQRRSYPRS